MAPLRRAAKSLRKLSAELGKRGHRISLNVVADLGYSLQANRKTKEGADHPDRDAQFHYINDQVQTTLTSIAERKWAMVSQSV